MFGAFVIHSFPPFFWWVDILWVPFLIALSSFGFYKVSAFRQVFLVAQMVKNSPAIWETLVWSLGQEDTLEKGVATHSSILAWRITWTQEPGGLLGLQIIRQNRETNTSTFSIQTTRIAGILLLLLFFNSLSCVQLFVSHGLSLPGSSVHGIFQARILEWIPISFSRRSSLPRDQTCVSCIGMQFHYHWATREELHINIW